MLVLVLTISFKFNQKSFLRSDRFMNRQLGVKSHINTFTKYSNRAWRDVTTKLN